MIRCLDGQCATRVPAQFDDEAPSSGLESKLDRGEDDRLRQHANPAREVNFQQPVLRGGKGARRRIGERISVRLHIQTRFGDITLQRTRGYCKRCGKWRTPADTALGLEESAGYSPAVQAMAALAASKLPVAEASVVLEHLAGVQLPPATLDREARRQGQRAQRLRTQLDQQAATDRMQLELVLEPYQLIIQLDAWNLRERDA